MIACLDVDYRDDGAFAAGVLFHDWPAPEPASTVVVRIDRVEPYEPGQFYRRELPCLLAVLRELEEWPELIIIDGYVWLGDERDPGLGAHLHSAIEGRSAVVGVAKTRYRRAGLVEEVRRGGSLSPLYVTSVGMDLPDAARRIGEMHGPYRIPTLLKLADRLCRDAESDD